MNSSRKGTSFELVCWKDLEADGWIVGSRRKGPRYAVEQPGDLLAWKMGERAMLVECSANARSPWSDKTPGERLSLRDVAMQYNAIPVIAWKKPGQSKPVYLDEAEWP